MGPCLLTLPAPGDGTLPRIDRKVVLSTLRILLSLPLPDLVRVVTGVARRDPARLLAAVGAPDVGPLLRVAAGTQVDPGPVLDQAIPNLLAHLGTLPEPVGWDRPVDRLTDGQRAWRVGADAMHIGPDGITMRSRSGKGVALHDLPATPSVHPIRRGVHLALEDTFPLAHHEDHPDKAGNRLDLAGRGVEVWIAALDAALHRVEAGLPEWADELPLALQRVIPVGFDDTRHLSASYREAPGLAYLSLHPDPVVLAEAIVHEGQHGKLNRLSWLDPVLHNGHTHWSPSPVRPDLRPLMGVLLAVHAFVPVSLLHHRLRDRGMGTGPRFDRRRAEVLAANATGLAILEARGEPTPTGHRLIRELRQLHDAVRARAGPLPPIATPGPGVG